MQRGKIMEEAGLRVRGSEIVTTACPTPFSHHLVSWPPQFTLGGILAV